MSLQNPDFTYEVEQGVGLVTFCTDSLTDPEQISRIKDRLYHLLDGGVKRLILDFKNVQYIGSEFLGVLIVLRKKLSTQKPFQPPCSRKWGLFQICPDQETALGAMACADSDPLVFCAVKAELQEIFVICSLNAAS